MDEIERALGTAGQPTGLVPSSFAEKAMASLMQLHSQLMEEKERRVDLYRRFMDREQTVAELRMYVKLLEDKVAAKAPGGASSAAQDRTARAKTSSAARPSTVPVAKDPSTSASVPGRAVLPKPSPQTTMPSRPAAGAAMAEPAVLGTPKSVPTRTKPPGLNVQVPPTAPGASRAAPPLTAASVEQSRGDRPAMVRAVLDAATAAATHRARTPVARAAPVTPPLPTVAGKGRPVGSARAASSHPASRPQGGDPDATSVLPRAGRNSPETSIKKASEDWRAW
jgi:hypothetical protein